MARSSPRIAAAMAFDAFALMLAMLALGMLFARLRVFPEGAAETLNLVVLYVCLPAAIMVYVPRLRLEPELLGLVLVPWLLAATSWLLLRLLAFAAIFASGARQTRSKIRSS